MDAKKKQQLGQWGTQIISTAGALKIQDNPDGVSILFEGEPLNLVIEAAGVTIAAIDSLAQFQMLTAATLYERAQSLMRAADTLMRQARNVKE